MPALIGADLGGYDKFRDDFHRGRQDAIRLGWAWLTLKGGKLEVHQDP